MLLALAHSLVSLLVAHPATASTPAKPAAKEVAVEACEHGDGPDAKKANAPAKDDTKRMTRGEPLKGAPAVKLDELLAKPQDHAGKMVQVTGKVRKACERKGCWMELAPTEKGPGVRITFKDYAFFVPLDSAGSTAKVEGEVRVAVLSEDMAKHYASEGAVVPRSADGKAREVQLVARGVELQR
jgi:hypothetical protein